MIKKIEIEVIPEHGYLIRTFSYTPTRSDWRIIEGPLMEYSPAVIPDREHLTEVLGNILEENEQEISRARNPEGMPA